MAPLLVAGARLRAQPLRPALLIGGVALAFAMIVSVEGGSLVARQQALTRTLAATSASERGFRIDRFGLPLDAHGYADANRRARRALGALGSGGIRRVIVFRALRVQGQLTEFAATDDLAAAARVRRGRLPRLCGAETCELLQIRGGGVARLDIGGNQLRRVGVATLRDPRIFGDIAAGAAVNGPRPRLLLAPSVDVLQQLKSLRPFYRVYSWVSPLPLDRLHTWDIDTVLSDESHAQAAIQTDPAMRLSGPDAALLDAANRGRIAADRLVLVGGELSALLLGFALIAAIGLRRGLAAERRRLLTRGARRWQVALASAAEICTVTLAGALIGITVGSVVVAAIASETGVPAWQILEHTLLAAETLAVLGCGWMATTVLLTLVAFTREGERGPRRVRLLDVAAVGAAVTVAVALSRGALDPQSLSFGGTALFLLLPLLVCFVVAVVFGRLLGVAMRVAERLTRQSRISLRLAVLALARAPSRTVTSCVFVAVALGLALFAAGYRATLDRGAADQAGFDVPLDFTIAEGPRLLKPLEAASLQRFEATSRGTTAYPVLRLAATAPGRGSSVLSPTVLGVPAGALASMYWRSDFSPVPRRELVHRLTRAGEFRPAGALVPAGATTVTFEAVRSRGRDLDLRLVVEDERGRVRVLPLRGDGAGVVSARLPHARVRVLGVQLMLTPLEQFFLAHRETEGGVSQAPSATLRLGPLRARSVHESWLLSDWRGWRPPSGGRVVHSGDRLEISVVFAQTGARLAFRPRQPTDGRLMPVVTSPDLAAAAGGSGSTTVLDFQDVQIPARIVGVAARMPTVPADSGPFVLADRGWLSTAIDSGAPGQGTAGEVWLAARHDDATAAALQRRPFAGLVVNSRRAIERRLATDPLAHATGLALAAAAIVALLLAVLGFWVGIVSELRDERSDFFDLEAQGMPPSGLRAQLRTRAAILIGLGLSGGVCVGVLLSRLVVSLVRISATTEFPEPPLRFDAAWAVAGFLIVALLVLALAVAEGTASAAFRDARPRRTSWSLE